MFWKDSRMPIIWAQIIRNIGQLWLKLVVNYEFGVSYVFCMCKNAISNFLCSAGIAVRNIQFQVINFQLHLENYQLVELYLSFIACLVASKHQQYL